MAVVGLAVSLPITWFAGGLLGLPEVWTAALVALVLLLGAGIAVSQVYPGSGVLVWLVVLWIAGALAISFLAQEKEYSDTWLVSMQVLLALGVIILAAVNLSRS